MTPAFLRANLCFLHGTMTASEQLLRRAMGSTGSTPLYDYFSRHLDEETGHIVMLEQELAQLGVTHILKFPAAAQLAGAQYYYIEHEHPAMLLGYMAAMESLAPSIERLKMLEEENGPLTCTRHHALHDAAHTAELHRQIERLPEPLKSRVRENERFVLHDLHTRIAPMIELASHNF